jgi:hypothetical protein
MPVLVGVAVKVIAKAAIGAGVAGAFNYGSQRLETAMTNTEFKLE